eukprot:jgi/Chrpa1/7514/Chrysochromulina_OHIO_Genome00017823-RA
MKRGRWATKGGAHLSGLPMQRSGVSTLFDDLNLDHLDSGVGGSLTNGTAGSSAALAPTRTASTEASEAQAEADRYVQVIMAAEEPFQIVWASEAWLSLCEYRAPQVLGHTLDLIQGPYTSKAAVTKLLTAIRKGEPVRVSMINHTRTGRPFSHTLQVEPLRDSRGGVQCFQATSSDVDEDPQLPSLANDAMPRMPRLPSSVRLGDAASALLEDSLGGGGADSEGGAVSGEYTNPRAMLRTASEIALGAMLTRNGSELQISEMLDMFNYDALTASPALAPASPRCMPTPQALNGEPSAAAARPDLRPIPPIAAGQPAIGTIPETTREDLGVGSDDGGDGDTSLSAST